MRFIAGTAFLVLSLSLGAARAAAAPAPATTVTIEMRDDSFAPDTVRIASGDSVTWVNRGRNPHDVVSNDGAFASKILQAGESYTVTFRKIGHYGYYCSLHGAVGTGMHGHIYVGIDPDEAYAASASRTYPADPPVRPAGGRTIRVPRDQPTIQAAVDAASPGDMILIAPGTYHEAVRVTTPHLTLRGEDRNRVILDGAYDPSMKNGIAVFGADGVVVENMTARHYVLNGFYWRSVWGYRGSYLTAEGNGDYGIYSFDSGVGQFDHSYASGSPDSGFYIGQCDPCNALITDVIARHNAIGFSGTNANGNLVIRDSEWSDNMAGIVPNTLDREALAPQHGQTIVGNWVHDNNDRTAPAKADEYPLLGIGIVVVGGRDNEIAYNRVSGNSNSGIAVTFVFDENVWLAQGNRIHDNVVTSSGIVDLALVAPGGGGNCYERNDAGPTLAPFLQTLYSCGSPLSAIGGGDVGLLVGGLTRYVRAVVFHAYPHGRPEDAEPAPQQPNLPDIARAPDPAGPLSRIDTATEVRRAASRAQPASGERTSPVPAAIYALFGEIAPLVALVALIWAVIARVRRRRGPSRRVVLVPLGSFVVFLLAVAIIEVVR